MSTSLYHGTIGPLSGIVFPMGDELFFTSADDPRVYQVTHLGALTLTAPVEGVMADILTREVIEPRLQALTGGRTA